MNRIIRNLSLILIVSLALLSISCRSDGPSGVVIAGVWSGNIVSNNYDNDGKTVIYEFLDNGKVKIGDPNYNVIYEEAIGVDFSWSLSENYMTITAWAGFYYVEYYYDLIDDDTLRLILLQRNFFNDTYDEMRCGDSVYLFKSEETFSALMQPDTSY